MRRPLVRGSWRNRSMRADAAGGFAQPKLAIGPTPSQLDGYRALVAGGSGGPLLLNCSTASLPTRCRLTQTGVPGVAKSAALAATFAFRGKGAGLAARKVAKGVGLAAVGAGNLPY